jgi:hypothetical protein
MRSFIITNLHVVKKHLVSVEPKGSAPFSQSSATGPYPVLVQSTSQLTTAFLLQYPSNYLLCMPWSPKHSLPLYQLDNSDQMN